VLLKFFLTRFLLVVRLVEREGYPCCESLPLACDGCRSRIALFFARVLLVYLSCHTLVTRGRRMHVIVHVVVLRSCAWVVVLFESVSKVAVTKSSRVPCPFRVLPDLYRYWRRLLFLHTHRHWTCSIATSPSIWLPMVVSMYQRHRANNDINLPAIS
jgi:hypothetical protein